MIVRMTTKNNWTNTKLLVTHYYFAECTITLLFESSHCSNHTLLTYFFIYSYHLLIHPRLLLHHIVEVGITVEVLPVRHADDGDTLLRTQSLKELCHLFLGILIQLAGHLIQKQH